MKKLYVIMMGVIFLSLPMTLTGEEKASVQLAGLRIVGPGYGLNGTELQAFYHQSGTTLTLAVQAPENKKIVEIDDSKCSLLEFTDDQGTNLLDGIDWGGFPKITEDGSFALIEVTSKNRPSQDATRFQAKGTIHLRVAASKNTETIESLRLEVGTTVNVLQEDIKVLKVQKEDAGLILVLQINKEFRNNMKDIRFYTEEVNPIDIWSQGSFTFGNVSQVEYKLDIKSTLEALRVEIDLWQGLETVKLNFTIKSGLGF